MKHFITLKDIPAADLRKIITDAKKRKLKRKKFNTLDVDKDNLGYLQNLETWLNNHTWEKYEDINENKSEDSQRITRQL